MTSFNNVLPLITLLLLSRPLLPGPASLPSETSPATTYRLDRANSRVTITVGKTGALSAFGGHTHRVAGPIESGTVDVDPQHPEQGRVRLVIAASALKVSAEGEPADDVPKVQENMEGEKVLDVAHYKELVFESISVEATGRRGTPLDLNVAGRLTIRGKTQPVRVPVHAEVSDSSVRATGRFTIKQTDFGITPISVGGVVKVKNELDIQFEIVAKH